ncbi:MAG: helix-turn-helix transcriptional regulator [Candidatus Shapirobacteria bacterium]|nr:helix-turn-helix transcriptional regulator [Candidatus Shapirobacteria bacterium]
MDNWQTIKKEILSNSEVKKTYDGLDVEYQILSDMVRIRNKKKITQKELAKKMGTTQSALSRFEMGDVNPSLDFLKKVAIALGSKLVVRLE